MKSKYTLLIISKSLRPLYNFRYYILRSSPSNCILSTDSLYEVKMWLDIMGLRFNRWKQHESHFNIGTNEVQLILIIELET